MLLAAWTAAAGCAAARPHAATSSGPPPGPFGPAAGPGQSPGRPEPSGSPRVGAPPAVSALPAVSSDPARLAVQLTAAEVALGRSGAPVPSLTRQALIIQLACLKLAAHPGRAGRVIRAVPLDWRAVVA